MQFAQCVGKFACCEHNSPDWILQQRHRQYLQQLPQGPHVVESYAVIQFFCLLCPSAKPLQLEVWFEEQSGERRPVMVLGQPRRSLPQKQAYHSS